MQGDQQIQINDLLGIVRRRAGLMVAVAGAITLIGVFIAAILPNEYEAYATLLVEPQTVSPQYVEAGVEGSDLNNRLHLMTMEIRSRTRLSKVIDDLGLYEEESAEMTREDVIDMMNDRIRVEPILPELASEDARSSRQQFEINTFRIHFRADSPRVAAAVANRLAQDFIDKHIQERVQLSGDTSEFIRSELERLTQRIQSADDRISQVKSESQGSLPENQESNQRLLERAVDNLRAAQRELAVAQSDASFYRQQARLGTDGGGADPGSPAAKLRLLELRIAEYQGRGFTEKHPDVVATREEIAGLRAQLEDESEGDDAMLSPLQQSAMAEAERAELRAASAEREIDRLQTQIGTYEERLAATPRVAERLAALERQHEHLSLQYREFSDKLQSASVAADMESGQKGEKFRLLERAFPPTSPTSPNRPLIVAMAVFLGLALGGGLAVVLEASDRTFRTGRQLQPALGLPVLASIPKIVLESDRVALRRKRLRQAVAAAAVVLVVLAGSVAGNWMVNGTPGAVQALFGGDSDAEGGAGGGEIGG